MKRRGTPAYAAALVLIGLALLADARSAGQGGTLRIYLARHGETDWNLEGRLQGGTDTALNATGRKQAQELAVRLRGLALDVVYSSALRRSRETADIARGAVPLVSLPGLNERRLGKFEGQRLAYSTTGGTGGGRATSDPITAEYERRAKDPNDTLDGGESLLQFDARVAAAVKEIRARHRSGSLLIVGHGVTNRMILRALLGLTLEEAGTIQQANDELYLIEIDGAAAPRLWKLITLRTLNEL